MRSRKIGVAFTGVILISAAMTSAVTQDVPLDFFINPDTGELNVVIVVGSEAASEDVISAAMLAVTIGNMCAEEPNDITFTKACRAVHENIPSLAGFGTGIENTLPDEVRLGFPTVDVPDAQLYKNWEQNTQPINYTLRPLWYFDDSFNGFWGHNDGHFQPWETHEEIQIRFDSSSTDDIAIESDCVSCLYGENIEYTKSINGLDLSTWYGVPGLLYRADNIFVPPSVVVEAKWYSPPLSMSDRWGCFGPGIFAVPEPWLVIKEMLPQFSLFSTTYTVVHGGPLLDINTRTGEFGALHGTPCLVTGEPHFEPHVCLYMDELIEFGSFTIELMDVDMDQTKGLLKISENRKSLGPFWMLMDSQYGFSPNLQQMEFPFDDYPTCDDLNENGALDPGEMTNIISMPGEESWDGDFNMWIVDHAGGDVWAVSSWEYYIDDHNHTWQLFGVTDIVIDGLKVFTDDQGSGVEIQVYWLENKKVWYNHLCSDPWVTEPNNYQLFLDAYQAGWDEMYENSYVYQPPGTGLWPPAGLTLRSTVGNSTAVGNGFLDNNDGHIGYEHDLLSDGYFPEQNDFDRDSDTTNDCRSGIVQESCVDRWDIEDPVIWHGKGPIVVEINVCLCDRMCATSSEHAWVIPGPLKEPAYFTIEVADAYFCDDNGIDYRTFMEDIQNSDIVPSDIDETGLVVLDTEINLSDWKSACGYNLILVGGPVANIIVKQLVGEGISTVDWSTSPGEWEYIPAPYNGCDILIVAGEDRDATSAAVQGFIDYLQKRGSDYAAAD